MGDHRADIKIEFTIHGKTYEMDSYINWFDDGSGVDARVVEFFRNAWNDAKGRYDAACAARLAQERALQVEVEERNELARLKAKYDA